MLKLSHSNLTISERAEIDNMNANISKNIDSDLYSELVVILIREKYSMSKELSILRKKMAGLDEGEFDEYSKYVEECKLKAKEEFKQ